jgi:TonB family protein
MSLSLYIDGAPKPDRPQKRTQSLVISLAVHVTAFYALMHAPEVMLPEPDKSDYRQSIEGKETKLVWYKFKELPNVTPPEAKPEQKPPRAEFRAPQEIVASRKTAPRRTQMVWTPAPELNEPKPVESPNILAIKMPEIKKAFVAPPDIVKPQTAAVKIAPDAPELQNQPVEVVKLGDAPKIVKRFVPPSTRVPQKLPDTVTPIEAPQLEAKVSDTTTPLDGHFKVPPRPFVAPAAGKTGAGKAAVAVVDEAPPLLTGNTTADLNVAVVGLNPANSTFSLPEKSNPAQFSAGPKVRPDGADSGGDGKGLSVPDLYVRGGRESKPDLIAQTFAAPTSALTLREAARNGGPRLSSAPSQNAPESPDLGAVKVSGAPDPRFSGRDVYMMAIQMPNLTSYSGSWLMWYSDRTQREVGLAPVAPPVAHRKVDPKYIAAAASERIEGKVQLACVIGTDGIVSNVELLRGLDDRLNQSAEEALAKWEFKPATRKGVPLAVDVVVEIPFRLEPRTQVRY